MTKPHNPLMTVRQNLSGMLRNEGVSLGLQRSRQHPARHDTTPSQTPSPSFPHGSG